MQLVFCSNQKQIDNKQIKLCLCKWWDRTGERFSMGHDNKLMKVQNNFFLNFSACQKCNIF